MGPKMRDRTLPAQQRESSGAGQWKAEAGLIRKCPAIPALGEYSLGHDAEAALGGNKLEGH